MKLKDKIRKMKDAKARHRKSKACEFPRTCGACHWYSGYIQCLEDVSGDHNADSRRKVEMKMKRKPKPHKFTAKELWNVGRKWSLKNGNWPMLLWNRAGENSKAQVQAVADYVNKKLCEPPPKS